MTIFRLRDINTGAIAAPPAEFDPNEFKPEAGWIIEYTPTLWVDAPTWKVYRQPTEDELRIARLLAYIDEAEAIFDEMRRELEG